MLLTGWTFRNSRSHSFGISFGNGKSMLLDSYIAHLCHHYSFVHVPIMAVPEWPVTKTGLSTVHWSSYYTYLIIQYLFHGRCFLLGCLV